MTDSRLETQLQLIEEAMPDVLYQFLHSTASAHPVEWLRRQATIALEFYFPIHVEPRGVSPPRAASPHPRDPSEPGTPRDVSPSRSPSPYRPQLFPETDSSASMSPRSTSPVSASSRSTERSTPTDEIDPYARTPSPVVQPAAPTASPVSTQPMTDTPDVYIVYDSSFPRCARMHTERR
ncbi:Hypp6777 [Branchiostoma lanceolatum]|uniref:Hypp6777 protein n=1 Tax=Branchiostoma lanceolatum TaxID=7740 RepID=A0A8J9YVK8_BRALA|nr:Hypp6777 [Branchiostoma lanceolatum]